MSPGVQLLEGTRRRWCAWRTRSCCPSSRCILSGSRPPPGTSFIGMVRYETRFCGIGGLMGYSSQGPKLCPGKRGLLGKGIVYFFHLVGLGLNRGTKTQLKRWETLPMLRLQPRSRLAVSNSGLSLGFSLSGSGQIKLVDFLAGQST